MPGWEAVGCGPSRLESSTTVVSERSKDEMTKVVEEKWGVAGNEYATNRAVHPQTETVAD